MKSIFLSCILSSLLIGCSDNPAVDIKAHTSVENSVNIVLTEFSIPNTTIRALEVLNDSTVWFGGSNGHFGYTLDNGKNWIIDSLSHNDTKLEIRSISVLDNGDVFLVGVSNPAVVYKSENDGKNWTAVYTDTASDAFFDAIEFWDAQNGMLLGDAQNGCFHIALTNDGGNTWTKVACGNIPRALDFEGPFAASNTNIAISGNNAWFGTGGKTLSRVFSSANQGKSWRVTNTPIVSGQQMTGIFSIDFYDENIGITAGGNWEEVSEKDSAITITTDGGINWNLIKPHTNDGYISCIQFVPESNGKSLVALKGRARGGESSMSYSNDFGQTWQVFPNSNYLAIQFANQQTAWISGKNKIAKLTLKE
jgi:photosystem II stability/assembly factor-like uncharacterized protein